MTKMIASMISVALVSPFVVLELWNNGFNSRRALDYLMLFGVLWALSLAFVLTATAILQALRDGNTIVRSPIAFSGKLAILVFVTVAWVSLVNDQLPCFMGSMNCD